MKRVCKDCGTVAEPETKARGTMGMEIVLWLCFLVPGFIYSIWRLNNKYDACPACGSETLLPLDSPMGKQVAQATGYVPPPPLRPSAEAVGFGRKLGRMVRRLNR